MTILDALYSTKNHDTLHGVLSEGTMYLYGTRCVYGDWPKIVRALCEPHGDTAELLFIRKIGLSAQRVVRLSSIQSAGMYAASIVFNLTTPYRLLDAPQFRGVQGSAVVSALEIVRITHCGEDVCR